MLGVELHVRAVLALQQFTAIIGVQAAATAGVQQMIGARHPQQEMAGEIDPDQRDLQALGQLQCDQPQGQRLAAPEFQHFVEQGHLRAQRGEIVLGEPQVIHAPQQRLGQFAHRQHRQAMADPLLQVSEVCQHLLGIHLFVMFGRHPQRGLEQRGW